MVMTFLIFDSESASVLRLYACGYLQIIFHRDTSYICHVQSLYTCGAGAPGHHIIKRDHN